MQKVLWMLVDLQRQELPLAVVDTQKELARLAGSSVSTVRRQISRVTNGIIKRSQYVRVTVDWDEEEW